jgi:hypothetical protein
MDLQPCEQPPEAKGKDKRSKDDAVRRLLQKGHRHKWGRLKAIYLEQAIPQADAAQSRMGMKVNRAILFSGRFHSSARMAAVLFKLKSQDNPANAAMPQATRVFHLSGDQLDIKFFYNLN